MLVESFKSSRTSYGSERVNKEMSLLLRPNFLTSQHILDKHRLMLNSSLYIYLSSFATFFPNASVRLCPIKLEIGMLYHINNIFGSTVF